MTWLWLAGVLSVAVVAWIAWELYRAPRIDLDRCPYGATERDCGGPCAKEPPCVR